uniref:Uncharacterized protein n=1 Tax=Panagrolaimus davidi TaxID=227884 RepID=A0A914QF81_9BILA
MSLPNDRWNRMLTEWTPDVKRPVGRPPTRWIDDLTKFANKTSVELFEYCVSDMCSEIPIEIDVDFSETTVNRAIQFCYGKIDGIKNYENDLIKFADKYGIKGLKKACLQSLKDQILNVENVCEIVEIAFEQNYALLKQKCLKFIIQKKAELGSEKLSKLPNEILVSTILSL